MVAPVVAPVVAPAAGGIITYIAGSTVVRYVVGGTIVYLSGKQVLFMADKTKEAEIEEFEKRVLETGGTILEGVSSEVLDIVRGLGGAIIDGLDNAYDSTRRKLRGHEPDVVAAIVAASLSIGTVLFLYYSMKSRALGSALGVK